MVTWGTSPRGGITDRVPDPASAADTALHDSKDRAFVYMDLKPGMPLEGIAIDRVFIGSCTNSRIKDLRAAAKVLDGRRTAVPAMVVPGSGVVKAQAEAKGLDAIFKSAGFEWREAGCSMCVGRNGDLVGPGERCASTPTATSSAARARGPHSSGEPGDGGRCCHSWQADRCPPILGGLMDPFTRLDATAVPIGIPNLDTDQIVPARFLWRKRSDGWRHLLFNDLRFDDAGAPRLSSCSTGRPTGMLVFWWRIAILAADHPASPQCGHSTTTLRRDTVRVASAGVRGAFCAASGVSQRIGTKFLDEYLSLERPRAEGHHRVGGGARLCCRPSHNHILRIGGKRRFVWT
jgi:hypothetical protein